jgi:cytidylate kinase
MAIISIARGTFSGAEAVAEQVARRLGVPCVSRELIAQAAQRAGVAMPPDQEDLVERGPSMWERFRNERELYLDFVRCALHERACEGDFVYHGNGAHLLLDDVPQVLRVRVVAPLPFRIAAARSRLRLDEAAAAAYVRKVDAHRERWARFLYGVNWSDPLLYDLVVNLDNLSVEEVAGLVVQAAALDRFRPTEVSARRLADSTLCCRVRAELARDGLAPRVEELELTASAGVVAIGGLVGLPQTRDTLLALIAKVPGVTAVTSRLRLPSDILRTPRSPS